MGFLLWILYLGLGLGVFRAPDKDELIYLHDAMVMADCLMRGQWFGNEWVGLHGFLFKLPAALLFLGFGNSVFVATLVTLFFALSSCALCFFFLRRFLEDDTLALMGVWLVSTSYYFISTLPTFLRDIPALFAVLLLLHSLVSNKKPWVTGLALVLLLDAKEHVFFQVIPGLLLGGLFSSPHALFSRAWAKHQTLQLIYWFLPSGLYVFLMLFTGLVPLNLLVVSLLGLNQGGISESFRDLSAHVSVGNSWFSESSIFQFPLLKTTPMSSETSFIMNQVLNLLLAGCNEVLACLREFLSPYAFTFLSTPKVLVVPALFMSGACFFRWQADNRRPWLLFIGALWSYLLTYFLGEGETRYLLPVLPLTALFFILFLKECLTRSLFSRNVLILTTALEFAGICFENAYVAVKLALSIFLLGVLWTVWLYGGKTGASNPNRWIHGVCLIFGGVTLGVALFSFFCFPNNQFHKWRILGKNMEAEHICKILPPDTRIYTNWERTSFLWFRNAERREWFSKRVILKDCLPKKWLMKYRSESLDARSSSWTFSFKWEKLADFRTRLDRSKIEQVAFFRFTSPEFPTPMAETFDLINTAPWLRLSKTVPMKNKTLYLYDVLPTVEA